MEDEQSDDGGNQIQMAVLDGSASVVSSGLVEPPHSGDANWPNMVWTGTQTAIVYYPWRADFPQIFMTIMDADGSHATTSDLRRVGGDPRGARFPDVVWWEPNSA